MVGVLNGVLQMIEEGATHLGVATDHVIESFRNGLWSGYKTGDGIEPALRAQFLPLEEALDAMGVTVWPMIELEADDALASAAAIAAQDSRVQKVCIWTPDKDLAQCVRAQRVVQVDRKTQSIRDADGVRAKFGVSPELIPDYLALVGDSADGYPGIPGIGPKGRCQACSRDSAKSRTSPRSRSANGVSWRSSSRIWRLCAPTSRCSPMSTVVEVGRPFAGISSSLRTARQTRGSQLRAEKAAAARISGGNTP